MEKRFLVLRYAALLACMLAILATMPAAAKEGGHGRCGLLISYMDGKDPIPGVTFKAYRAAGYLGHERYALDGGFKECGAVLDGAMTNSKWEAAAQAMLSYAKEAGIRADASGKTGEDGILELGGLEAGVYLVEGGKSVAGGTSYTPQAFCVKLPGYGSDGELTYTVTAEPKHETETEAPEESTEPPATPKTGDTAGRVGCQALILAGFSVLAALAAARAMRMRKETGHAGP